MALTAAFVGLPGCGKSTTIELIKADPRLRDFKVAWLDIDSSPDAPFIRSLANAHSFHSPARTLLFWILRLQQYDLIRETRDGTDIILIDSFWGTTLANDMYGNGVPQEIFSWLGECIKQLPDITFFLDVPLEVARKRKQSKTMDDPEFAKRVEQGYQELAREFAWVRIDANRDPAFVARQCLDIIIAELCGPKIC